MIAREILALLFKILITLPFAVVVWPFYAAAYLVASLFYTIPLAIRRVAIVFRMHDVVDTMNVLLYGSVTVSRPKSPTIVKFKD